MRTSTIFRSIAAAAMFGLLIAAGCETNKDVGDPADDLQNAPTVGREGTPPQDLSISPSSAVITNVGAKVVFSANQGKSPYTWTVSNGKGTIDVSANQVVYTAVAIGDNAVTVTDSIGNSASAVISGSAGSSPLTASANPSILTQFGAKSIITASGGVPPYTWSVVQQDLGHIIGSITGPNVVYVRDNPGDNAVTVTDATGDTFNVLVQQP